MANRNDMTGETTALVGGLLVIKSTGKVVVESGATVAGLAAYTVQTGIADLTDSGGGAAADGTIAVVTAPTALTDSTTGTPGTTLAAVTNPDMSDWDGATVFPSAAQATAIGAAVTSLKNSVASLAARQAEDRTAVVALTDAVKELSTKINAILASLRLGGAIEP